MGLIKLLIALIRNQLFLNPIARRAFRHTRSYLSDQGFNPKEVDLSLGLAEPEDLSLIVVLASDSELTRFNNALLFDPLQERFRSDLANAGYPMAAISQITVKVYSHEQIMREGGYYNYLR